MQNNIVKGMVMLMAMSVKMRRTGMYLDIAGPNSTINGYPGVEKIRT
jgi:hypothetical protein